VFIFDWGSLLSCVDLSSTVCLRVGALIAWCRSVLIREPDLDSDLDLLMSLLFLKTSPVPLGLSSVKSPLYANPLVRW
jgi:hypothetical protein